MYSKNQAVKLLRADERVRQVKVTAKKMYIYTHPIIPVVTKEKYKRVFLCPIGTYKITITNYREALPSCQESLGQVGVATACVDG